VAGALAQQSSASGRRPRWSATGEEDFHAIYPRVVIQRRRQNVATLLRALVGNDLERLAPEMIEIASPLRQFVPPAAIIDKQVYSW
jgi:hypothetical protein